MSGGYYRTWFGNFTVTDNQLVTPADYDPYCVTAPTDARLGSISGSQVCGLADINGDKFGQVDSIVTLASHYGKQTEVYNGADLGLNIRLPHGAQVSGGWNIGNSISLPNNVSLGMGLGLQSSKANSCFVVDSPQQLYSTAKPAIRIRAGSSFMGPIRCRGISRRLPCSRVCPAPRTRRSTPLRPPRFSRRSAALSPAARGP